MRKVTGRDSVKIRRLRERHVQRRHLVCGQHQQTTGDCVLAAVNLGATPTPQQQSQEAWPESYTATRPYPKNGGNNYRARTSSNGYWIVFSWKTIPEKTRIQLSPCEYSEANSPERKAFRWLIPGNPFKQDNNVAEQTVNSRKIQAPAALRWYADGLRTETVEQCDAHSRNVHRHGSGCFRLCRIRYQTIG